MNKPAFPCAALAVAACSAFGVQAQDAAPAPAAAAASAPAPIAAASAASAASAAPGTVCIDVEVQNVRPQQGLLFLAAYGSAETYGKQPLSAVKTAAGDATTRLQMCGISGDTVAITMYQDLDSDGKMGRNIMCVPTEPWGSSGTPGAFGPTWETGKVTLNGSPVVVKLSQ
jgi:uncharacterized protein (DUF2141 family)